MRAHISGRLQNRIEELQKSVAWNSALKAGHLGQCTFQIATFCLQYKTFTPPKWGFLFLVAYISNFYTVNFA